VSPSRLDPTPFTAAAPPKRWPWLLLALVVGILAIAVPAALHGREQTARRAEMQATLFATELRDSVREVTAFGNTLPDAQLTRALGPVIASTATTAGARLDRLEAVLPDDPRTGDLRAQLLAIRRIAASDQRAGAYGDHLSAAADRMARTADAIARAEHDRATLIARESMAGSALAVLLGMGLIALVLRRSQRLLLAAGRRQAAQLRDLAGRDPLTGLHNRRRLSEDLARMAPALSPDAPVQVLICDLDGFKALNDSLGHDAGDELLVAFGLRLAEAVGAAGAVYRLGGDEFCVLSRPGLDVATPVFGAVAGADAGDRTSVRGSAGLALWPTDAPTAREAMRRADERMYAAKERRRASAA
jgi:diguanylate cyclase (GGDEF)-like protein